MAKSTITVKYQTTAPKEIRERLGVGPQDVLQWDVVDGYAPGDRCRSSLSARKLVEQGLSAIW